MIEIFIRLQDIKYWNMFHFAAACWYNLSAIMSQAKKGYFKDNLLLVEKH